MSIKYDEKKKTNKLSILGYVVPESLFSEFATICFSDEEILFVGQIFYLIFFLVERV